MLSSQLVNEIFKGSGIDAALYADAFEKLKETEAWLSELDRKLSSCPASQDIINTASAHINNPLIYLNSDYSINALSQNLEFDHDEEWDYMESKRYLSPLTARIMKEGGDLNFLAENDEPLFLNNPTLFPFPSVNCNVRLHGEFKGRVTMLGALKDLDAADTEASKIIVRHLVRLLEEDEKKREGGALKKMLKDILSGSTYSEGHISNILIEEGFPVSCVYALYCTETNSGADPQVPVYYESALERVMAGERVITFIYGDSLILIAAAASEKAFSPVEFKLNAFLNAQNLKAGAGNYFKSMADLFGVYSQALAALKFGQENALTGYKDVMLDYILSYIPDEDIKYIICDDIFRILDADKGCSFSMYETLAAYIDAGCSLQKSADALYIHKNTMMYRLGKIKECISCSLECPDETLKLYLSMRLLNRGGNIKPG